MTPSERLIVAIYNEEKWHHKPYVVTAACAAARRCGVPFERVVEVVKKSRAEGR